MPSTVSWARGCALKYANTSEPSGDRVNEKERMLSIASLGRSLMGSQQEESNRHATSEACGFSGFSNLAIPTFVL